MQSYSEIAKKNCPPTTLTSKIIEAAVKRVCDREDRSRNVIVYGVEETNGDVLQDKVKKILEEIDERPVMRDCVRVGVKRSGATLPRPVKFSLSNADHVAQGLRSARRLHTIEGYKSVYICPNRTVQSYRTLLQKLKEKLKEKRKSEPNRTHSIRNNRIVSSEMKSDSSRDEIERS